MLTPHKKPDPPGFDTLQSLFQPGVREMIVSTLFFLLMNICVKWVPNIPTHEVVVFRAFGILVLCTVMMWKTKVSPRGNKASYLLLRGLYGTGGVMLYVYTLKNIPLASAVTLQFLSPIFSSIFAIFILKEIPRIRQWGYFALSFSGVFLIKGFDPRISFYFLAIGIIAPMFSALAYNYVRKLKDYDHPLLAVFYFPLVTLILIGPYTFTHWVMPQGLSWLYLALIGIFTYFGQYYMTLAFQAQELAYIINFKYLGVIYALFAGYFMFGEIIQPLGLLGMGLIIGGLILSSRNRQIPLPKTEMGAKH